MSATGSVPAPRARAASGEMAFCGTVLRELLKKSHYAYSFPFLTPVDPVALGIPDYFDVIKTPMDLDTVRRKYEAGKYADAAAFEADVRLIFANCYAYNAPDSDVVALCRRFEAVFDDKWHAKPGSRAAGSPRPRAPSRSGHDAPVYNQAAIDDLDSDSDKILEINRQLQLLQKQLSDLLTKRASRGAPAAPAPRKPSAAPKARAAPKAVTEEDFLSRPMTFEEKRQLSMDVNDLAPERLGRVVEIIQAGISLEAEGESDTIELDIEALDVRTLRNLQRYVMECRGVTSLAAILGEGSAPKRKKTAAPPAAPAAPPADDLSSDDDDL
jgi:bromodomain-containing factor 1